MKRLMATILTIVMLIGIAGVVPVFADVWTPTSSDDGYTKVLADYDMENLNGITGTQKMTDPGFDNGTFDTNNDWTEPKADYFSIVSAAAVNLPSAEAHGNVLQHTGPSGTIAEDDTNYIYNTTAISDKSTATKAIIQTDIYIDVMSNNLIDVLSVNGCKTGGSSTNWNLPTIRFWADGKVQARVRNSDDSGDEFIDVATFETKKWYTVTVALDISAEAGTAGNRSFSAWLDDKLIVDNKMPAGKLDTCEALKHFNLYMSWVKGTVDTAPAVYWDNVRVYTGDYSVSGSPRYTDTEILGGTSVDSPVAGDNHGKVIKLESSEYSVKAVTNPAAIDSTFAPVAPTAAKIAERSQIKLESDIYYLTAADSKSKVGVYYIDSTGAEQYADLVDLSACSDGWHNVVIYLDAVNGKFTSYIDGVLASEDSVVSDTNLTAPCGMYVLCKKTTVYVDNMRFSVPEYYSEFGGGIALNGTQVIADPEFNNAIDTEEWTSPNSSEDCFTIVSAADVNLPKPVTHGSVLKQVGPDGDVTTGSAQLRTSAILKNATKAVLQADIYIDKMSNNLLNLFNMQLYDSSGTPDWDAPTVRFSADGTIEVLVRNADNTADEFIKIGTFEEQKWYTVTVAIDVSSDNRTISVWLDGVNLLSGRAPSNDLNTCKSFRSFQLSMSWNKGTVSSAPVVYWDNVKAYSGNDAVVSGIKAPVFVETRQGENKYNLAYLLKGETSPTAALIAAVYTADDLLANVSIYETKNELSQDDCEVLITGFEKNSDQTLGKMLWQNFTTIKPLVPGE